MRNSIRTRFSVAFMGLAVGPLLLVGVILSWLSFSTQMQQALNLQREVARRVAVQVTAFFEEQESQLRFVSQAQGLQRMELDQQRNLLSKLLSYQNSLDELVLLDSLGREQIYLSRLGLTPTDLGSRSGADEFSIPQTTGQDYFGPVRSEEISGEPLMTIAVPLIDVHTGRAEGVLIAETRLKKIWEMIASTEVSPGQSVYIVDSQSHVVAHLDPSIVLRGTFFELPDHDGIQSGLSGSRVVLAIETIHLAQQEFHIVAEQTTSEALALGIDTAHITVFMVLLMLVLSGTLGFLMVYQVVQPIEALAATALAIGDGDMSQQVIVARRDELGILGDVFNKMTGQLRTVINNLEMQIADRKQAEEQLRYSEARYRAIVEDNPDLICRFLPDTTLTFVNEAYCQYFDRARTDLIDKPFLFLLPKESHKFVKANIDRIVKTRRTVSYEHYVIAPNGERRWLHWTDRPIFNESGDVLELQSIGRDITERIKSEKEIQRLNEELEQRVRERTAQLESANNELESFTYSVSHDLRAPVRAIEGFSQILVEEFSSHLPLEARRLIGIVQSNTRHMGRLIDDLLTFSRLGRQPVNKQTIRTSDMVHQAMGTLQGEMEGREVKIKIGKLPDCEGDPSLIEQVWLNLLSNAIKYSRKRKRARIEVGCLESDGQHVYFVKDNGVGFDMKYADKLFGVFQRLHHSSEFEGTGVGLAIVERIIHRHSGLVWAESEPGKGATFFFKI